ncbi:CheY-like superfamily [Cynara cardunculus var. scolymus]|uniref:CheY-like superfamily n=1 Tax=Cynara cardunculus var. scolymus TaxID=59895 RepID=A0A118JGQ4_CYNCS|nr:CheY-like superfamily [Cynara cardunculus var. scolymus]
MGVAAGSQFHVLAVDDSIINRKLIERLLKTSSFQVTTLDSGNMNSNQPFVSPNINQEVEVNLIIIDYCMPGMTGYDLLKKVKILLVKSNVAGSVAFLNAGLFFLLICQLAANDMGQDNDIGPTEHVGEQDNDTVGA